MHDVTPVTTLRQFIMGFLDARLVYVAAELGIADLLKDGPKSSHELAERVQADAGALHRVLRGLAQLGVLVSSDERFDLTPVGELLRSDVPGSLRPSARMWGSHFFQRPFLELVHTVKTGEIAFDHVFGRAFFAYLADHPEDAAIFDQGMAGGSSRSLHELLSGYDFSGLRSVVDVGGGNGAGLIALVLAHPQLHGTVLDLPHLQAEAERAFAAAGVADRCRFEAGSFFEAVPEGADAYLLKSILHDWDDAQCIAILRQCRRAMAPGGRVLAVGHLLPDGHQPALAAVRTDLTMLTLLKGRERTEAEFRELFTHADLQLVRTLSLPDGSYLLEGPRGEHERVRP